jgi:hypothetical protein
MPEAKYPDLQEEEGGWSAWVHQFGSPWIRTLAPFRNILAGEEVCFQAPFANNTRHSPNRNKRIAGGFRGAS